MSDKNSRELPKVELQIAFMICFLVSVNAFICSGKSRANNISESDIKGYEIESDQPLPVMYHIGEKTVLFKNHGRSIFTDEEWSNITKAHAHFRKGLYVGQHPAYSERYAHKYMTVENKGQPWMMTVKVKPECLQPNRVAPYLTDLHRDRLFVNWFQDISLPQNQARVSSFIKPNLVDENLQFMISKCLSNPKTNNIYSPSNDKSTLEKIWAPFETKQLTSACANTFEAYLQQPVIDDPNSKISIIRDTYWPNRGFWYIRDRSCIDLMESDSDSILRMFENTKYIWDYRPFTSALEVYTNEDKGISLATTLSIFLAAIDESSISDLARFLKPIKKHASETGGGYQYPDNISPSNLFLTPDNVFYSMIDTLIRCSENSADNADYAQLKVLNSDFAVKLNQSSGKKEFELQKDFLTFMTNIDRLCGGQKMQKIGPGKLSQDGLS
ncbi:MAG: hypothetical protein NT027_09870, partial [Proteobacteria bacterium]|nr:hypothetical protein [Pseudomonadota bacterium]